MNCTVYSEQILALYVEGDLPETQRTALEHHIPDCAACLESVEEFCESQTLFKSLRCDAVPGVSLGSIRERVAAVVNQGAPASGWFVSLERALMMGLRRYAVAGLALAVLASGSLWRFGNVLQEVPPPPPISASLIVPEFSEPPLVATSEPVREQPVPSRSSSDVAEPPEPAQAPSDTEPFPAADSKPEQMLVQLITDDPNVIIYWLVDEPGE